MCVVVIILCVVVIILCVVVILLCVVVIILCVVVIILCVVVIMFLDLFGPIAMYPFSHVVPALAVRVFRTVCSGPTFCGKLKWNCAYVYTLVLRSGYISLHQMSTKFIVYEFFKTPATFSHAL